VSQIDDEIFGLQLLNFCENLIEIPNEFFIIAS